MAKKGYLPDWQNLISVISMTNWACLKKLQFRICSHFLKVSGRLAPLYVFCQVRIHSKATTKLNESLFSKTRLFLTFWDVLLDNQNNSVYDALNCTSVSLQSMIFSRSFDRCVHNRELLRTFNGIYAMPNTVVFKQMKNFSKCKLQLYRYLSVCGTDW